MHLIARIVPTASGYIELRRRVFRTREARRFWDSARRESGLVADRVGGLYRRLRCGWRLTTEGTQRQEVVMIRSIGIVAGVLVAGGGTIACGGDDSYASDDMPAEVI